MARYNTPVKDWVKYKPHGKHKFCERTLQQGVTQFGRKKKNACKLVSSREILNAEKATLAKLPKVTYQVAFPKIKLV